jgi:hypothetical protein
MAKIIRCTLKSEENEFRSQNNLLNADSGCLGLSYRRRTYKAAKVVGELSRSFDPAVSEWGNPPDFGRDPTFQIFRFIGVIKMCGGNRGN